MSEKDLIPRVIGYNIPRPKTEELYHQFMLSHFKPFSITNKLVKDHDSFQSTFSTYSFNKFHLQIINNWEEIHLCEDMRDAERLKKQDSSLQESQTSSTIFDNAQYEENDATNVQISDTIESFKANQEIISIHESGFFTCEKKSYQEQENDIFLCTDKKKINEWTNQLKHLEKSALSARRNSINMGEQTQTKI